MRFKISIDLETVEAQRHADARQTAERVVSAIEQLTCNDPELADIQLVEVRRVAIERATADI